MRDVFVIDRVDMVESLFSDACISTQSRVHTAGNHSKQANNDVSPIVSLYQHAEMMSIHLYIVSGILYSFVKYLARKCISYISEV